MDVLKSLAQSRKFWLAVVAVAQSIIFSLWPNFPTQTWVAIDAVLVILINAIATEDAAEKGATTIVSGGTTDEDDTTAQ